MQAHRNISKMFNRLKVHFTQNKLLLLAVIISLLLHGFLLAKLSLLLPALDEKQQILEMRLVKLQPVQKSAPIPIKQKAPAPEPTPPAAQDKIVATQPAPEPETVNPVAETAVNQKNISTIAQSITETPSTEITESTVTAEQNDLAKEIKVPAYKYVETEFEVRRGSDASAAGVARIVFTLAENNTYTLVSVTKAKGLVSLFFSNLEQKSEGMVIDSGLMPNHFSYQYGDNKNKMQSASFAWSDSVIVMRSAKGEKTETLPVGTQDFLSFMYQFMFSPPLENTQITMTNGKRLRTYIYSFAGEEVITTKIGDLNTIHLLKQGDEEDKTELWLAIDYQNLPVKIRKTEKNGSVIEQTATKISTTPP